MKRRRTALPPPAEAALRSPLDTNDLLEEILLRLPPLPSSLPRASCVCKRWRRLIVSSSSDHGRFRAHHRDRNHPPPLHDFFLHGERRAFFWPTLERPDRIPACRFIPKEKMLTGYWQILGCSRGLVLHKDREEFMVLDPIAGDQHPMQFPSSVDKTTFGFLLAMVVRRRSCSYRLVALFADKATGKRVVAYVYSSESGSWVVIPL